MQWYDSVSDEQIEWLKNNRVPWYLLTDQEKELFNKVAPSCLEVSCDRRNGWEAWSYQVVGYSSFHSYRLKRGWERPNVERWEFNDVPIGRYDLFLPSNGAAPTKWYEAHVQAMDGYVGIIWEWRGWRWVVDVMGRKRVLSEERTSGQNWHIDANVELPKPVAVRFRVPK